MNLVEVVWCVKSDGADSGLRGESGRRRLVCECDGADSGLRGVSG